MKFLDINFVFIDRIEHMESLNVFSKFFFEVPYLELIKKLSEDLQ
jgi:hypothetical protein